jgi:drug/metabolite transporter (DMT)-like permease
MSTPRFYVLGFGALLLFDTLTQVSLKLSTHEVGGFAPTLNWIVGVLSEGWLYGALAGYLGAFFTWMTLLKHAPIGPAFAASHLEVVAVLIISVVWFGERLSWVQGLGALLILAGIVCLAVSEDKSHPASPESGN